MVDETDEVVQKYCGQILFLSTDNIALNCEFCQHDLHTLEDLFTHINEHFPELPEYIKHEDSISCGSDFESLEAQDMKDILADLRCDPGSSELTVATKNLSSSPALNNKETIKREQSVGNQRKRQPERTCKSSKNVNRNISRSPIVHEKARYKPAKRVKKFVPVVKFIDTKRTCSVGKENSTEQQIITSLPKKNVTQHRQIHREKPTIFICDYCQKQFQFKRRMREHIRHHFNIKPFKCTYCHKGFSTISHERRHEMICSKSGVSYKQRDLKFQCKFCPRKTETQKQLNDHENIHSGKRPHQCRVCNKSFASRNTLLSHVKMHADEKRYECSVCEKKFAKNAELEHHTREKHLPDTDPRRYFPCLLCEVKLKSYCQYKTHMRKHRAVPVTFTCGLCQKQFKRRDIMTQHMKVHSAIRPTCNYCQKSFGYTSSKNKHEKLCSKRSVRKRTAKLVVTPQ